MRETARVVSRRSAGARTSTLARARAHTTQQCTKVREKMAPARTRDLSKLFSHVLSVTHFSVSHRRCFFIEFSSFSPGIKNIHFHIHTNTENAFVAFSR